MGRRRLATGSAIAIAAIGIGLAAFLVNRPGQTDRALDNAASTASSATSASTKEKAQEVPQSRKPTAIPKSDALPSPSEPRLPPREAKPPAPPEIVTVNYSKFASREVRLFGVDWLVEAGHFFASEGDEQWQHAWCYTSRNVDGVEIKIELANRERAGSEPRGPLAPLATLQAAGISRDNALTLAMRCPWLDERSFTETEFSLPPGAEADKKPEPKITAAGPVLRYEGEIEDSFAERLQQHQFEILEITSPGGVIAAAMDAGLWLREQNKAVRAVGECLSACVLTLAGGGLRTADEQTHIGVHRFYQLTEDDPFRAGQNAQQLSSAIIQYLEQMGINSQLFHRMSAVPSNEMEIISHDELREWQLLSPDPSLVADQFVTAAGLDAIGYDLVGMPVRGVSIEVCLNQCRGQPQCAALTYNASASACFLKSDVRDLLEDARATTIYRKALQAQIRLSPLKFYVKTELRGRTYKPLRNASYVDCVLACNDDGRCDGFNYNSVRRSCQLLSSVTGKTGKAEVSAGAKQ